MARDNDSPNGGSTGRDRYRDNDDVRDPSANELRDEVAPDTKNEARGSARENVGSHSRGTDAGSRSHGGNDHQASRGDQHDEFDDDLERDNRRGREGSGMSEMERETRPGAAGFAATDRPANMDGLDDRHGWRSHARQGQAESPVELTHNEPPKHKEGHH